MNYNFYNLHSLDHLDITISSDLLCCQQKSNLFKCRFDPSHRYLKHLRILNIQGFFFICRKVYN